MRGSRPTKSMLEFWPHFGCRLPAGGLVARRQYRAAAALARRNQVVRHRTRVKNEVHAILHAHLIPPCPHADLFSRLGRSGSNGKPCRATKLRRLCATCANSIGWAKTLSFSIARSPSCYRRTSDQATADCIRHQFNRRCWAHCGDRRRQPFSARKNLSAMWASIPGCGSPGSGLLNMVVLANADVLMPAPCW